MAGRGTGEITARFGSCRLAWTRIDLFIPHQVGEFLIDVLDERVCFDRMHLNANGNALVAKHVVVPIVTLMPDAFEPAVVH